MAPGKQLSPAEWTVLNTLYFACRGDRVFGLDFDEIGKKSGLSRNQVRDGARSLAKRHLARCEHGVVTIDGLYAGSAYFITKKGRGFFEDALSPYMKQNSDA